MISSLRHRLRSKGLLIVAIAALFAPVVADAQQATSPAATAARAAAPAEAGLCKPGVIEFDVRDMTGAEEVERLARIPLIHQPGTTWEYSLATDVLGRVVEAASGKRLSDFMSERLFKPLEMSDTGFW